MSQNSERTTRLSNHDLLCIFKRVDATKAQPDPAHFGPDGLYKTHFPGITDEDVLQLQTITWLLLLYRNGSGAIILTDGEIKDLARTHAAILSHYPRLRTEHG